MKIKILGSGCPSCIKLTENAKKAVTESGIEADVDKITDINKIIEYGVMTTPAIVIDEEIKSSGRIPSVDEIKKWLK